MHKPKKITVLGNFSGRNAGDNAILGNLLADISAVDPEVEFIVPTLNANFVRAAFGQYRIKALGMMPWNGALKIFGLPTLRAMLSADLILVTDNILFDRSFFNPAFNYLSTIALIAPMCRRRNIPIVLYNASVGPINTPRGERALQKVLDASPACILRDQRSNDHMRELNLNCPEMIKGADCALNTVIPESQEIDAILAGLFADRRQRRLIGVNINSYLASWQGGESKGAAEHFTGLVADVVSRVAKENDAAVLVFVTQVMDHKITGALMSKFDGIDQVSLMSNPEFTYNQIAGVLSRVDLLIGMRTHAQILATSVGTPVVNINSYPKSRAFLETLGLGDWSIDVGDLTEEKLSELVRAAWDCRQETRDRLTVDVQAEKELARSAANRVIDILNNTGPATAGAQSL